MARMSALGKKPVRRSLPELDLLGDPVPTFVVKEAPVQPALDLSGKPKFIFLFGMGQVGKSTLARWIVENSKADLIAASTAHNQTLTRYFPDGKVFVPDDRSAAGAKVFLEELIDVIAENPRDILIDFPGGDRVLLAVLEEMPDLLATLTQAGMAPVGLFPMTPRADDLTPLAELLAVGFLPEATALILNTGRTPDLTRPPVPQFERVIEHSAFMDAEARGARRLWMPRLFCAQSIEDRQLLFAEAATGQMGAGKEGLELGFTERLKAAAWNRAMTTELAPIASWLP